MTSGFAGVGDELDRPLAFVSAAVAETHGDRASVVIIRSPQEFRRWLSEPLPGVQWLQVELPLHDSGLWAWASRSSSRVPLDVLLSDPASQFSDLYRLVDVRAVRDVRVTMPALPGFLKAVKLAASLQLPVRILPGQPTPEVLVELAEALEFYLHEPMVEAPVEFFHSLLASACGADTGSLWVILEEDPATFLRYDDEGNPRLPRSAEVPSDETSAFVEHRFESLVEQGAECVTCPWLHACRGYFKWPDAVYSCSGVKQLFSAIDAAAGEIGRDLGGCEIPPIESQNQ
jgi:hypothetical protein